MRCLSLLGVSLGELSGDVASYGGIGNKVTTLGSREIPIGLKLAGGDYVRGTLKSSELTDSDAPMLLSLYAQSKLGFVHDIAEGRLHSKVFGDDIKLYRVQGSGLRAICISDFEHADERREDEGKEEDFTPVACDSDEEAMVSGYASIFNDDGDLIGFSEAPEGEYLDSVRLEGFVKGAARSFWTIGDNLDAIHVSVRPKDTGIPNGKQYVQGSRGDVYVRKNTVWSRVHTFVGAEAKIDLEDVDYMVTKFYKLEGHIALLYPRGARRAELQEEAKHEPQPGQAAEGGPQEAARAGHVPVGHTSRKTTPAPERLQDLSDGGFRGGLPRIDSCHAVWICHLAADGHGARRRQPHHEELEGRA